ncbi:3-dehydroquinate synthase [Halorhodospira halophila]|uniref:3-dehydroquinate synthase n=1 Tax=Halorhodospira halophila (strain DSM 244 / SL1) TaxID=349124 RepID=AROB_HALHL|nr:3-dehydroquinate synthase [Halorhodospira halophila]A1WZA9.1 RecName: Full=3-dehydroquinate synthase; Short=DHQS [Halorhodospira halophila SL1]ABM63021.1 3-dehydroquinate synthase [Halorhodospira halophila SL1]MBK1727858.1 3-dehydroquinate synthase [Halorhodospira halophila]
MRTQWVELGERSYPIYIGDGVLDQGVLAEHLVADRALLVSNETVAPLYAERLAVPGAEVQSVTLHDGERYKTLQTCEQVYDALIEGRFDRSATVIALGGGVVGDMAGFCAATYQRGVGYIQVPTTLLAQVDSSVGGKTGVNHPRGKNMIGAFHQPRAVVADTGVLATLPEREYNAGLAEVVKYGLIRDPAFFDWLEAHVDALRRRDPEALAHAVAESCRNKAEVVAADEREAGERALLNLGHTFGHAIETYTDYCTWLHGEAVAAGMVMAARMSVRLGWLQRNGLERTIALLEAFGLPTRPPAIPEARFRELMSVDKKNRGGQLRLVLLRSVGDAVVTGEFAPEALTDTLVEAV